MSRPKRTHERPKDKARRKLGEARKARKALAIRQAASRDEQRRKHDERLQALAQQKTLERLSRESEA